MGFQSLEFRVSDFRLSGVQGFRGSGVQGLRFAINSALPVFGCRADGVKLLLLSGGACWGVHVSFLEAVGSTGMFFDFGCQNFEGAWGSSLQASHRSDSTPGQSVCQGHVTRYLCIAVDRPFFSCNVRHVGTFSFGGKFIASCRERLGTI